MNFTHLVNKVVNADNDIGDYKTILQSICTDLPACKLDVINKEISSLKDIDIDERLETISNICGYKNISHPHWGLLGGRIKMLWLATRTPATFHETMQILQPLLDQKYHQFCMKHHEKLESMIVEERDWNFDKFAMETLIKGYLLKFKGKTVERPSYLYLRVATYLYMENDEDKLEKSFEDIKKCYDAMSTHYISHASPTQFNAGMKRSQLASCFLLNAEDDMRSLAKSWHDTAIISMNNGGIGLAYDSIRHSEVGHQGNSRGIVPWIKIQNEILSTVDQAGRRPGSGTIYINDWHIDVFEFVDLKKPTGNEEYRARDLTYGLMLSDEFMRRVEKGEKWSLFCPAKTNQLQKTWGREFEERYRELEKRGKAGEIGMGYREVDAQELFNHIVNTQIETGMPFMIYKDAANRKSNQKNLGTIRLSNLCTEILEYTDENNIASCNLASIPLSKFVNTQRREFDFEKLGEITRQTVRNLAQVIDRNYYPDDVPEIRHNNNKNRPIGIGVQDLAGCFALMDYSWTSDKAAELNEKIARVMYYHAMDENVKMAEEYGAYDNFKGSPASEGLFQFDLWELEKIGKERHNDANYYFFNDYDISKDLKLPCSDFDWENLRDRMKTSGIYFSLMFAQMPTASTAQILGNNESIEPYTQMMYTRTVTSGCYSICNKHFVNDMEELGMWNDQTLKHLITNQGSISDLPEPEGDSDKDKAKRFRLKHIKRKYKTAYELSQKTLANLYMARAKYQCQTTSNNLFMSGPIPRKITAFHFHTWRNGAKTGMYYMKQTAKTDPLNFSLDSIGVTNSRGESEICISCGA